MKKTILSLIWLLIATISSGKAVATNDFMTNSVNHSTMNHSNQSQSISFRVLNGVERNETDTTGKEERTLPKSKQKKHVFAKVLLGLTATFYIVIIIVFASSDGWHFM